MGVMAISAPRLNIPMPRMTRAAPKMNPASAALGMGTDTKHSSMTSPMMGTTLLMASRHFSLSTFLAAFTRRLRNCRVHFSFAT